MLTSVQPRPAYRPFDAAVRRVVPLSPSFVEVTFAGPELDAFGREGLDQRIKILFPPARGALPRLAGTDDWYASWLALPDEARPPLRTYTVRRVRPDARELDVLFVRHEVARVDPGPAAQWLAHAAAGHQVVVVGPDARSRAVGVGIDWRPGSAGTVLLAGDETAAPAVLGILEALPDAVGAQAFIEVPRTPDTLPGRVPRHARLHWLPRDGAARGSLLLPAVTRWLDARLGLFAGSRGPHELPDTDVDLDLLWDSPETVTGSGAYAWLAGEAAMVKALRRALVTDRGVDRRRVAFLGYWREGRAEL